MKLPIFQEGNGIFGSVSGLEPSGSPWREKRENQMYLQSRLSGEKKCTHFSSPEKNTFGGELRLRRPSRQRRASRAPLGLPTPDVGSTLGQRWVSSLAISDRFSLILQVSSIETEDKKTCICKMVDFPIRKWDFRVCGWSGAFWEPLERKKEKTKCIQMYL